MTNHYCLASRVPLTSQTITLSPKLGPVRPTPVRHTLPSCIHGVPEWECASCTPSTVIPQQPHTHCKRGHELTGDNVYAWTATGRMKRTCRICHNERNRMHSREKRRRERAARNGQAPRDPERTYGHERRSA